MRLLARPNVRPKTATKSEAQTYTKEKSAHIDVKSLRFFLHTEEMNELARPFVKLES
jgi:hypothetical protein